MIPAPATDRAPLEERAAWSSQGGGTLAFRPDIEGLRGVAVLMVVAFHAGLPGFSGGFVGVDVFFVISGFLISGVLLEEHQRSGTVSLPRFYARRARRLLPAAFLMIAVTLVAARFLLSPLELRDLGKAGVFAAASGSNVWFAVNATRYFGEDLANSPFIHTWSLAVEEQFYLLWPALILLLATFAPTDRLRRLSLVVVTIVGLGVCIVVTQLRQGWAWCSAHRCGRCGEPRHLLDRQARAIGSAAGSNRTSARRASPRLRVDVEGHRTENVLDRRRCCNDHHRASG